MGYKSLSSLILKVIALTSPFFSFFYYTLNGHASSSSMSSFAYADAAGYKSCMESIAYFGKFNEDYATFCYRRPIYPFVSGLILRLTRSIEFTQLVYVLIFALVLLYLVTSLLKVFDLFSVSGSTIFLVYQWHSFASISLTTEVLGLILGPLSVALAIEGLRRSSTQLIALASMVMAISFLVRPGNFFLLLIPLFLILKNSLKFQKCKNLTIIITAILFPFLGAKLLGLILKIDSLNSSLNFWGVLYGLSDNNKTWVDAQSLIGFKNADSEINGWSFVRERTLENFFQSPLELPHNVLTNITRYIEWRMTFINSEFQSNILHFSNLEYYGFLIVITVLVIFGIFQNPIKQAFLSLFIILTTIVTFGIFYNAEPYRTISSFHFLFILMICNGLYHSLRYYDVKLKPNTTQKSVRASNNDTSLDCEEKISIKVHKTVMTSTLVLIVIFSCFLLANRDVSKTSLNITCVFDKKKLLEADSLQILRLDEVEKPEKFLWGPILKSLPPGFLVHGIYQGDSGSVGVVNFYLASDRLPAVYKEELRYCITLNQDQTTYPDLWKVGLKIADIKIEQK